MAPKFDAAELSKLGWRQGAVLGPTLAGRVSECAPQSVAVGDHSVLVVVSHNCDVLNHQLAKEPVVEVLSGNKEINSAASRPDITSYGRNPRQLRLPSVNLDSIDCTLDFSIHDRWTVPREWLAEEQPTDSLAHGDRRIVTEWLAVRYIRPSFPTAFDLRWRQKSGVWQKLLRRHSRLMRAVHLRLHSYDELAIDEPYRCDLILAVRSDVAGMPHQAENVRFVESDCLKFWSQFSPSIECYGVEAISTAKLTLQEIEPYQKLDLNWVSIGDGTVDIPRTLELTT